MKTNTINDLNKVVNFAKEYVQLKPISWRKVSEKQLEEVASFEEGLTEDEIMDIVDEVYEEKFKEQYGIYPDEFGTG